MSPSVYSIYPKPLTKPRAYKRKFTVLISLITHQVSGKPEVLIMRSILHSDRRLGFNSGIRMLLYYWIHIPFTFVSNSDCVFSPVDQYTRTLITDITL